MRTFPSFPIALYDFKLQAAPNSTVYWEIMGHVLAQLPNLSAVNVSAFTYLYPSITPAEPGDPIASFEGVFALPEPTSSSVLEDLLAPIWRYVNETYPGQTATQAKSVVYPNLYSLFLDYADDSVAGVDKIVGSWLLPPETLTDDAFTHALITFLGESGGRLYMVSGRGVWDAKPRGGSDAVNPAWRKALVHAGESGCLTELRREIVSFYPNALPTVTSQDWTPLNTTQQAVAEDSVNKVQTEALRQLVPDSGAYLNEVCLSLGS